MVGSGVRCVARARKRGREVVVRVGCRQAGGGVEGGGGGRQAGNRRLLC